MTNTLRLKAAIVESGLTRKEVSHALGISTFTLHKKLHNSVEFKASEIQKLKGLLKITDVQGIFFAQDVEFNSTEV